MLMDRNDSTPLSTPPPAKGTPSQPSSNIPSQLDMSSPAAAQKKRLIMIGGGAVALVAAFGIVPLIVLGTSKKSKTTPTPTASATPKVSVAPELARDYTTRIFIKNTQGSVANELMLSAPSAWNGSFTATPSSPSYPWNGAVLLTALKSSYSPLSTGNANVASQNFIAFMDVTDWLSTPQATPALTADQKKSWYTTLNTLTKDTLSAGAGISLPISTSEQGRVRTSYIETQGGTMRGITYLTQASAGKYEPTIVTVLAGTFSQKSIIMYSRHAIRDKQWSTLAALQSSGDKNYVAQRDAAITAFSAGTFADDTTAIHEEFIRAIKSFTHAEAETR